MEKEVSCISCRKTVIVKLISYGYGYVAVCPECERIAYISNTKNINTGDDTKLLTKPL